MFSILHCQLKRHNLIRKQMHFCFRREATDTKSSSYFGKVSYKSTKLSLQATLTAEQGTRHSAPHLRSHKIRSKSQSNPPKARPEHLQVWKNPHLELNNELRCSCLSSCILFRCLLNTKFHLATFANQQAKCNTMSSMGLYLNSILHGDATLFDRKKKTLFVKT